MAEFYYTNEKNVLILIALLKENGIRKIVASPGTTNISFTMSLQYDSSFEIYSAPDERSAAYMACGLAATSEEPVVLTCTGATASRNYIPGLTEAYYRKLPVCAVTATQDTGRIGHLVPQVIDRTQPLNDIVTTSILLPVIHSSEDEWKCNAAANKAILELTRDGGGPVHINLVTTYSRDFSVKELSSVRKISRYTSADSLPELPQKKIAVFVGSHKPWSEEETSTLDTFCGTNNAVVFCDWTSNYYGKYRCDFSLASSQAYFYHDDILPDIVIHIGDISGAYELNRVTAKAEVWRVNPDGEIRDTFRKLTTVFEMTEDKFFKHYAENAISTKSSYAESCNQIINELKSAIPDLPFSNLWMAQKMANVLPEYSILHLGILNSLRSWNIIASHPGITGFSNTGGFGIDGILSTLLGSSLAKPEKLHFCVIGDLAFFYDMNVLGNRHIGNNLRILLINNGCGTEFRNYNHFGAMFGDESRDFVAAEGHYGRKSSLLIKHYAEDSGFEYLSANNKDEFLARLEKFTAPQLSEKPIILEAFTNSEDESNALYAVQHIIQEKKDPIRDIARKVIPGAIRHTISKVINGVK